MLWHLSEHLGISVKRVNHIVTQVLGYRKIAAVWVPYGLNDEHRATRVGICWESLLRYERQGDVVLNRIVRGDESWCLQYDPEHKMHESAEETSFISPTKTESRHTQRW